MLSYKVDLFVQLGLIFQSTGFVFFNTLLIFFIVKAEEKLQYELRCCHDRGYYECSEKYPVFCGKALYYIRHKIRRIENDRRKLSANGRTKRNVQRVYTVDKSRLELTGQPKSIYLAFEQSEKEVADLHQRTKEGIETARLNGKQIGRAAGLTVTTKKGLETKQLIAVHSKDFGGSLDDAQMMKLAGLARNTFYKYKRELRLGA